MSNHKLRVAFIHPDLGIGGAERLVVDAALGLQRLGHSVDIYTSHHDVDHCFEETRDGTLRVHCPQSPFPRSLKGKLHILFAHLRQLHLTAHLLGTDASTYDIYFVDQLSTCIPFLRTLAGKRVVFYCHFPDKLLADGEYAGETGTKRKRKAGLLKRIYRFPMDWLEETTTAQADIILANSHFTARVFQTHFSIPRVPRVVHPGINISAYEATLDAEANDVVQVRSDQPTFLSLNRFEKKKNAALAVKAFALLRKKLSSVGAARNINMRLVLAGGYDPRVQDNIDTLNGLIELCDANRLHHRTISPSDAYSVTRPPDADVLFLQNFTTAQRSALLAAPSTLALLYTPRNEHFGIGPVEGMICGLPVLACDSGGPTETVVAGPPAELTGWLVPPEADKWAETLETIVNLSEKEREAIGARARSRAREKFGMEAMAEDLQAALFEAVDMGPRTN